MPPPLLTAVKVGITSEVGLERMNNTVAVAVGVGVSVLRGVGVVVGVKVEVGNTLAVWVDAALTVCAMNVLMAAGSGGGGGVASDGTTHAKTMLREINQLISLALRVDIFPLAHPASSLKRN